MARLFASCGLLVAARTAEPVADGDDTLDMPYRIGDRAAQLVGLRLTGDRHDAIADQPASRSSLLQHGAGEW